MKLHSFRPDDFPVTKLNIYLLAIISYGNSSVVGPMLYNQQNKNLFAVQSVQRFANVGPKYITGAWVFLYEYVLLIDMLGSCYMNMYTYMYIRALSYTNQ